MLILPFTEGSVLCFSKGSAELMEVLNVGVKSSQSKEEREKALSKTNKLIEKYIKNSTVTQYKKFISLFDENKNNCIEGAYNVYKLEKGYLVTFCPILSDVWVIIGYYQPENNYMIKFMDRLLRFDSNKEFDETSPQHTIVKSGIDNNYQFIAPREILDIVFTKAFIESNGEKIYRTFEITSKNGKVRKIVAPHRDMVVVLRNLNTVLQRVYDKRNEEFQVAYKKGKNIKTGALLHTSHKYVYNMDLHDFYPSCKKELVDRYVSFLFKNTYNPKFLKDNFYKTILYEDGLYIGSPVSGTIANAILSRTLGYIKNICSGNNIAFSDYADDLSFSSDRYLSKKFVESIIVNAFAKYQLSDYFTLNEKKAVGFSGCHRKVTGVTINDADKITVSRKYWRELRSSIYKLSKGENVNVNKLRGKIAYATMLDDSGKVYNYLKKFMPTVKKYSLCSQKTMKNLKNRI